MEKAITELLDGWDTFYVVLGSASAALIGLMFVAMTLISESEVPSSPRQLSAFGTPTIVHFVAPLTLAAILTAPWERLSNVALMLELSGIAGLVYGVIVTVLAHRQREAGYQPEPSDWVWYSAMPIIAYSVLTVSAVVMRQHPSPGLFGVAASALLLLLTAIHNAWDTVTYIAMKKRRPQS